MVANCNIESVNKTDKINSKKTISQEKDRENNRVAQWLYGLDARFDSIRSTITSRSPLPCVEECYNLLIQEEDMHNQRRPPVENMNEVVAFVANSKQKQKEDGMARSTCTHSNSVCSAAQQQVNCFLTESDKNAVSGLSNDQLQILLRLLNASRGSGLEILSGMASNCIWLLDTGASHHMTSDLSQLENIRSIAPVNVILADGSERLAVKEGTDYLGQQLVLKSVFYVEALTTSLISVGQLLDENDCVVQMANKFLIIQDRVSKTVIDLGRRGNGTFYFQGMDSTQVYAAEIDKENDLWHHRFGHPSEKFLSNVFGIQFSPLNSHCETCIRSKQTRDPFPFSLQKANDVFDLIHCDV